MFKKQNLLVGLLALSTVQLVTSETAYCQTPLSTPSGPGEILVAIPDQSIIASWNFTTGMPVFTNSAINSLFTTYGATSCKKAYSQSRFDYMRKRYIITCSNVELAIALQSAYPQYFSASVMPINKPFYTPNDYTLNEATINMRYLDYIRAEPAWSITKGDPDVIIGIADTYLKTDHPEILGKVVETSYNIYDVPNNTHGTMVSGIAAGATDNNKGLSSIGFNCRIHFAKGLSDGNMLLMSSKGRKVLNASWGLIDDWSVGLDLGDPLRAERNALYNEFYENGSFVVISAGNGKHSDEPATEYRAWKYAFPASLDHVFSVSSVGWAAERGGTEPSLQKGVHEITLGDTVKSHQHNDRVDLLAPGYHLGGLTFNDSNPSELYTQIGLTGTSFASPMVAGTAGLMLSAQDCLSPYQLEYLLKKGANSDILDYPENLKFEGRLGAGALDAYKAVYMAAYGEEAWTTSPEPTPGTSPLERSNPCNDLSTQTMYIQGVELNMVCRPGLSSNGVNPIMKPIIKNGTPPFTYRWEPIDNGMTAGNNTTLDDYQSAEPEITSSSANHLAYYRVVVYDNSEIQKVATKVIRIQLRAEARYDLAMRDSYADMLDEPNSQMTLDPRDWQIWESPDLWTRRTDDAGTIHQNPEYFTTNPNYIYIKVRNVGCEPAPANIGVVDLYWTKASTGENWKYDWDGSTSVPAAGGGVIPGGGLVNPTSLETPYLAPGDHAILKLPWHPTNPADFAGSPSTVDVCLLARLENGSTYPYGITIPEVTNAKVTPNIRNNNNIVTRNLLVTDIYAGNTNPIPRRFIDVTNAESATRTFTIEMLGDRNIHPHFAGDFSAFGHIRVYLGATLFNRWMQGGAQGNYASINQNTYSVVFDGKEPLRLKNISMTARERFPVQVEFVINDPDQVPEYEYNFHLRQFESQDSINVYGNVSMQVNTHPKQRLAAQRFEKAEVLQDEAFTVHPNPVNDYLNITALRNEKTIITVYDITGRTVYNGTHSFEKGSQYRLATQKWIPGMYILSINSGNGESHRFKVVKK